MEVQSFAACVCGEEHGLPAADEVGDRRRTLLAREPSVQQGRRPAERPLQMLERVAIFGEHDGRFADTAKQPDERGSLRLTPCRCARGGRDLLEQQTLARRIAQRQRGEVRRFISRLRLGIRIEKRQARLPRIMRCVLTQRVETSFDGLLQRSRARQRALVQHRERQPHGFVSPFTRRQRRLGQLLDEGVHPLLGRAGADVQQPHAAARPEADVAARPPEYEQRIAVTA